MTWIIANWKYLTIGILCVIVIIQAFEIKQYKIEELQAKVKTVEKIVTVQEKRNEVAQHRPSDRQLALRLRQSKF